MKYIHFQIFSFCTGQCWNSKQQVSLSRFISGRSEHEDVNLGDKHDYEDMDGVEHDTVLHNDHADIDNDEVSHNPSCG